MKRMDRKNSSQSRKAVKTERDSPSDTQFKIQSPNFVLTIKKTKNKNSAQRKRLSYIPGIIPYDAGSSPSYDAMSRIQNRELLKLTGVCWLLSFAGTSTG